ncbi:MAG: hypothetical protein ABUS79_15625, partial [Pseudomonadota bacterium]
MALLIGLAYWDAVRASQAALDDLADEQATLARGVAATLGVRADALERGTADGVLQKLRSVEQQGVLRLFLLSPGSAHLQASDGRPVLSDVIVDAARRGDRIVRLPRKQASNLDLPARAALVGLAPVESGALSGWTVAVAATALRERDRGRWAQQRSILTVVTAAGLLLAFALAALRNQKKELDLERELAVAATRSEQNERLASATRAAALGTLAIGVAHEVSTPLGVIAGRAEQLLARVGDDPR